MKIDVITKSMAKRMVEDAVRKEMNQVYKLLEKFRKKLVEMEKTVKK